ncbi:MAG: integrase, partial [Nitrososphaerota archaeon]
TADSYSRMLEDARKLIDMSSSLKPLLLFTALSGLRVSEALEAVRLYRRLGEDYLNPELGVLEHFRYPAIFIRRTKKAYITVLDDLMTEALRKAEPLSYNALRLRVRRRNGSRCRVYMLRKLWATYMRLRGVEPEVIDLLQGRTPRSIFLKHYYRPDIAPLLEGVRTRLRGLENELGAS